MGLVRFFRRHKGLSYSTIGLCGLLAGAAIGIYVNLVTPSLSKLFGDPGSSFFWVIVALVLIGTQVAVIVAVSGGSPKREAVQDQVRSLLEATTRALIHPHKGQYPIRAQCRLADPKTKKLVPFCQWSEPFCNDSTLSIDYDGQDRDVLIISRVYRNSVVLAEDLPSNHNTLYVGNHQGMIWQELRCVLAAPIRDPRDLTAVPIGTISFDSSKPLSTVKFDTHEAKKLAEVVAGSAFTLLNDL
jgi:hypothetical protein